jgi:hypothetical protein
MNFPVEGAKYAAHGIQRGGNHAVINWILGHFKSSIFYNCCYIQEEKVFMLEQDLVTDGESPYEVALASFEDIPERIEEASLMLNSPQKILIIRDFYNTYASRFQKRRSVRSSYWLEQKWSLYDDTTMWKRLAKKFIEDEDSIKINYNMWFSNEEYRRSISTNFGQFSDERIQRVLHFGGGSSFDCRNYDGKASEMNVLKRWIIYYNDKEYACKILGDEEAREMNRQIFGFVAPRMQL